MYGIDPYVHTPLIHTHARARVFVCVLGALDVFERGNAGRAWL